MWVKVAKHLLFYNDGFAVRGFGAAPHELLAQSARRGVGRTLDEVIAHLKTLGAEVSRSALGHYTKNIDVIGKRIQESRALAEVLAERYGSGECKKEVVLPL